MTDATGRLRALATKWRTDAEESSAFADNDQGQAPAQNVTHARGMAVAFTVCANELDAALLHDGEMFDLGRQHERDHQADAPSPTPQETTPVDLAKCRHMLSVVCDALWNGGKSRGQHLWSIPVDKDRDFDCLFSAAFDELERLRAAPSPTERADPLKDDDDLARVKKGVGRPSTGSTASTD